MVRLSQLKFDPLGSYNLRLKTTVAVAALLLADAMFSPARAVVQETGLKIAQGLPPETSWEGVRSENGIRVFRGKTDREGFYSCKAEGIVHAPLVKVASVLIDLSRRNEWFPELIEGRVVKHITPTERLEYMAVRTPFPLANRDFAYRGTFGFQRSTGTFDIHFASVEVAEIPETKLVRGRILDSSFSLRSLGPNDTMVEHVAAMDPRGSVPRWIVNLVQANVPFNTIANLRLQATKSNIVEFQDVVDLVK